MMTTPPTGQAPNASQANAAPPHAATPGAASRNGAPPGAATPVRARPLPPRRGRRGRVPAPILFMTAGVSQYCGAALAVGLFAVMGPVTVAWLRVLVAAVVLVLWRRPWRAEWTPETLRASALFGLVLTLMNVLFYVSIAHIPLGTAVAVEFAGPVAVAAWGSRTFRARAAIVFAALGVALVGGLGLDWGASAGSTALGLAAAVGAGAAWAAYIILGRRVATQKDSLASLSVGMSTGALALVPFAAAGAAPLVSDARVAAAALGVGILSSAIPYAIDQVALRRLSAAVFALLNSLLPATATVVGLIALGQVPSAAEAFGLIFISWAVALTTTPLRRKRTRALNGPGPR